MNSDLLIHHWLRIPYTLHVRGDRRIGKPKLTLVFLHGIGGTGTMWQTIIAKLQAEDVRIITLDLIGFGQSAKPTWATYSANFQAKSLRLTLAKLFVTGKVVIIGHSLGALVAVEAQHRYRSLAKVLILCSPPLYRAPEDRSLIRPERALRSIYKMIQTRTERFLTTVAFATKYKLINTSFDISSDNIDMFYNTLNAAIINQTAMDDIVGLNVPIEIVHGLFDPLVVAPNLYAVAKLNPQIYIREVPAGHEIVGGYVKPLVATIQKVIDSLTKVVE